MDDVAQALANYSRTGLAAEVLARARAAAGDEPLTVDRLALFDEFHMGGRFATRRVADTLAVGPGDRVLDVGCGLGGPTRVVAAQTGAHVTGVDLTPEYVEAARELSGAVGLADRVEVVEGEAGRLPFEDGAFTAAMMLHVGMNVADKTALVRDVRRVLTPGARFVVFDLVLTGDARPDYPLPWSATPEGSYLVHADVYADAFAAAGFELEGADDLGDEIRALAERQRAGEVPGQQQMIDVLFGEQGPARFGNLVRALGAGVVAPVVQVARAR